MRYCSLADLTMAIPSSSLRQLSNDDPLATAPNMDVVEEAVSQAEELIDGYLRGRYTLPLATVPSLVKQYTVAVARHWLYARRPEGNDLPDAVTRTYKDAIKGLEFVRDGKITLGVKETGKDAPESGEIRVRARPTHFNADLLSRY